ncbi:DnaJ family domain-containing protein [Alkalilimnicola ehrlichii]|uniref:DnaJ family domain-containing protein n=1 Tax=Alkalilimnicola ehrlichii TaxID=351052 RepID=UPI003B9DF09D
MKFLDELADARIREALEQGELDDLPGAGKPLALDDDSMVPEELRTAYRILKNANCLPPELHDQREVKSLEALLAGLDDDTAIQRRQRTEAEKRLALLRARLEQRRGCGRGGGLVAVERAYQERLLRRLGGEE